jgi:hypothetical protein
MEPISEIIIWGGGSSLKEGLSLGLKDKLKDKFVITTNFSYNHFTGTFLCFTDYADFYIKENKKLESLPMIVGIDNCIGHTVDFPNTIWLKESASYNIDILNKGVYRGSLTGIFALSLAQWLMNYTGIIYLLGFDWTISEDLKKLEKHEKSYDKKIETHYYSDKEIPHRGQHFIGYFSYHNPDFYFKHFKEPEVKIYNVSPKSTINNFEKIDYTTFFTKLNTVAYNQEDLRIFIKNKLGGK